MRDAVGYGRYGPVYRAVDDRNGRAVTVNVFDQGLTPQQAVTLAQALNHLCHASLDHPSIIRPMTAGADAEFAWLAAAYVEATGLDRIVQRDGPRPFADAMLWITQIAGALDFAAAAGTLHGALRSNDILLTDERALLTGLGLVQAFAEAGLDVPMDGAGISAQRAGGSPVTRADDIFALAAVTFEILCGRPLEKGSTLAIQLAPTPGLDHTRLRQLLIRSLSEHPAERPATALEFAAELQRAISDTPTPIPEPDHVDASLGAGVYGNAASGADAASSMRIPVPPLPAARSLIDDLPLRPDAPAVPGIAFDQPTAVPDTRLRPLSILRPEAESRTTASESGSDFLRPNRESESESRSASTWLALTVGLAIGLLGGFAAGFVVGQRDATPAPYRAERPVSRAQREPAPEPAPAPTAGQDFTESTVPATPVDEPDLKSTEPAERSAPEPTLRRDLPGGSEPAEPTEPADSDVPASIEVLSRPAGAQVFVDGRLVGRTPMLLSEVDPGAHAVRLALPGHQRWVTRVDVTAGSRARVAASLER